MYFVKTPWWLKRFYAKLIWHIPSKEKVLYFTFDDGPHPQATPFVLDALRQYKAKGTFFCIGKNVVHHPQIYTRITDEGHSIGNHTFNHANGWLTDDSSYRENIFKAGESIDSNLFRPPYGRIKRSQTKMIMPCFKVIMWDVLSADFDIKLSPQKCFDNVVWNCKPGSIVVFHDSQKAFERLHYALPLALAHFSRLGYRFEAIPFQKLSAGNS